jgi:hypothetical protein
MDFRTRAYELAPPLQPGGTQGMKSLDLALLELPQGHTPQQPRRGLAAPNQ